MKPKMIKYCPTCKKNVTVVKCGKPNNKQRYKCCKCKKRFFDRKYGIEIRSFASKFRNYGYSLREIAKIFCVSPNSARNWSQSNNVDCVISYIELIEVLKKYKELCVIINCLKTRISELEKELSNAEAYWQKKNEMIKLEQHQKTLNRENRYEAPLYTLDEMKIVSLHKEILKMIKPKGLLTVAEIEKNLLEVKNDLLRQNEIKIELETQTKFTREQYDIDKIINAIGKIIDK